MRSTTDNPVDPLGTLGAPIRPAAPAPAPDPFKAFEHINDHSKAVESIVDTLRRKQVEDDSEACDLADAVARQLGAI